MLARHADHFAAHVAAAIARRAQRRESEAEAHIARARELVPAGHPWAKLVPSDVEWQAGPMEPKLELDEPDRVYRVASENRRAGAQFGSVSVGRFLRMRTGELVFVNPVELPNPLVERIRSLGEVTHIVLPSKYHSDHAASAHKLFPKARLWGVPAQRNYPGVAHLKFDGFLSDDAPLFPGELDQVTIRGVDAGDVWLLDRVTRTLITTDVLFVTRSSVPDADAFVRPFAIFYAWAWGVFDRVGIPSYQPAMWTNIAAYQASLKCAFALDFDNVASCHGSWRAVHGNARQELEQRLGWILELNRIRALRFLGDFVYRHPGVFFRFAKEMIAARRKKEPARPASRSM